MREKQFHHNFWKRLLSLFVMEVFFFSSVSPLWAYAPDPTNLRPSQTAEDGGKVKELRSALSGSDVSLANVSVGNVAIAPLATPVSVTPLATPVTTTPIATSSVATTAPLATALDGAAKTTVEALPAVTTVTSIDTLLLEIVNPTTLSPLQDLLDLASLEFQRVPTYDYQRLFPSADVAGDLGLGPITSFASFTLPQFDTALKPFKLSAAGQFRFDARLNPTQFKMILTPEELKILNSSEEGRRGLAYMHAFENQAQGILAKIIERSAQAGAVEVAARDGSVRVAETTQSPVTIPQLKMAFSNLKDAMVEVDEEALSSDFKQDLVKTEKMYEEAIRNPEDILLVQVAFNMIKTTSAQLSYELSTVKVGELQIARDGGNTPRNRFLSRIAAQAGRRRVEFISPEKVAAAPVKSTPVSEIPAAPITETALKSALTEAIKVYNPKFNLETSLEVMTREDAAKILEQTRQDPQAFALAQIVVDRANLYRVENHPRIQALMARVQEAKLSNSVVVESLNYLLEDPTLTQASLDYLLNHTEDRLFLYGTNFIGPKGVTIPKVYETSIVSRFGELSGRGIQTVVAVLSHVDRLKLNISDDKLFVPNQTIEGLSGVTPIEMKLKGANPVTVIEKAFTLAALQGDPTKLDEGTKLYLAALAELPATHTLVAEINVANAAIAFAGQVQHGL